MKNNNLSLPIILFASVLIGSFSFHLAFAEIDTDKSVYSKGELVNISGSIDLQDDQKVNIVEIEIVDSDDNIVINEYTPINDDEFSRSYETNTWIVGDYTLTASYNDVEESAEFEISDSSSSDDEDSQNSNNSESGLVQQESSSTLSNTPDVPTDVVAKIMSPTSVELTWNPPTQVYGQTIQNYTIKQELSSGVYDEIASTVNANTKYLIPNLTTDETYTFVVIANYLRGSSDASEKTIVTLTSSLDTNSNDGESGNSDQDSSSESTDNSSSVVPDGIPDPPVQLKVNPVSSTQIDLLWVAPEDNAAIVGYGIEYRTLDNSSYSTVIDNTENTDTSYSHTGLIPNTTYIYRVFAINDIGPSEPSGENLANTLISDPEDDGNENNTQQQESESSSIQDGNSIDDSNTSSLSTDTTGAPVDLTAIPISQNRINLSWSAPTDNDDGTSTLVGYMIESKTSDESDYTVLVTNTGSASTTTYSHTGLTAGLTYNYRVSAINSLGESSASDMAEATIVVSDQQARPEEQSSLTPQSLQITLSTDKPVYSSDDPIEISGTISDPTENMLLGVRVLSSDGTIVYVRSVSIDNDNLFETTIAPLQRQSSVWSGDAEFTVEVTYNGRTQTTTTFETENSDTITDPTTPTQPGTDPTTPTQPGTDPTTPTQPGTDPTTPTQPGTDPTTPTQPGTDPTTPTQPGTDPTTPTQPGTDPTTGVVSNDEFETLKSENTALESANQQLQDENNQLKIQIDELNKNIEQLNVVIMEQVRVMMETITPLQSGN